MRLFRWAAPLFCASILSLEADTDVYLLDVPDYRWYAGCFGTATGNLMGYWDRHGLDGFYTGPTADGLAPLLDNGANLGIRSLWASRAGMDGRPADQPGHIDDYWLFYTSDANRSYQSTAPDPYATAGRPEHPPDCIGDFIGLSQKKWTNMNNECDGNVDAFSFVYWDASGDKRVNFTPSHAAGLPGRDIQSGLREWTRYRGYDADVFTQLIDFNPETPAGKGFTWQDLKNEIDAGFPLLVFLQNYQERSRSLDNMPRANPEIHGMMVYGYKEYPDFGVNYVYCRTSWGSGGAPVEYSWGPEPWVPGNLNLSLRGVIGYRPKPRIRTVERINGDVTITWDAPSSNVYDAIAGTTTSVHSYILEHSPTLSPASWAEVGTATSERTTTLSGAGAAPSSFFRVKLLPRE